MVKNVLLITIDCLRPDHLGCYGHQRDTSPCLDQLAKTGCRFTSAFTVGPNTPPSFNSLFTSTYPFSGDGYSPLPGSKKGLAEVLREYGYSTCGINSNAFLGESFHYERGFDHFENPFREPGGAERFINDLINRSNYRKLKRVSSFLEWVKVNFINSDPRPYLPAYNISRRALSWVKENEAPFFLWVHYMDAHLPYMPQDEILREWGLRGKSLSEMVNMKRLIERREEPVSEEEVVRIKEIYDSNIRFIDRSVQELLEGMGEDTLDQTYVFVMADHGEEFGEHGHVGHFGKLYDELLRIPLILSGPGISKGLVCDHMFSNLDISPTIIDLLGIERVEDFKGSSILDYLIGVEESNEVLIGEVERLSKKVFSSNIGDRIWSFRDRDWKLIRNEEGDILELYDLENDPAEQTNLAGTGEEKEGLLNALYRDHINQQREERADFEKRKLRTAFKKLKL